MDAIEAQRARQRAIDIADAPSGDVCACGEIHASRLAEDECEAGNPLGVASTQQMLTGGQTRFHRLVEAYHAGQVDATDIPGWFR